MNIMQCCTLVVYIAKILNHDVARKKRYSSHATHGNFHPCTAQMLFMFQWSVLRKGKSWTGLGESHNHQPVCDCTWFAPTLFYLFIDPYVLNKIHVYIQGKITLTNHIVRFLMKKLNRKILSSFCNLFFLITQ